MQWESLVIETYTNAKWGELSVGVEEVEGCLEVLGGLWGEVKASQSEQEANTAYCSPLGRDPPGPSRQGHGLV